MYIIFATQDFIDMLEELPMKYLPILVSSFIGIEKIPKEKPVSPKDNTFLEDLLSQIRNQELE